MQYTESQIREIKRKSFGELYADAHPARLANEICKFFRFLKHWTENPKAALVLTGPPGCGKTYLVASMIELLIPKFHFFRIYKENDLLKILRKGFQDAGSGDYIQHLQYLIDDDLVIIDDVGSSGHTDWREEILFEIVEYRIHVNRPTVYTTNLSQKEFSEIYSPRISSRLFAKRNTIVDFYGCEDLRQKIEN